MSMQLSMKQDATAKCRIPEVLQGFEQNPSAEVHHPYIKPKERVYYFRFIMKLQHFLPNLRLIKNGEAFPTQIPIKRRLENPCQASEKFQFLKTQSTFIKIY